MRILICEDSEHNLVSAHEFAEKVKGEHEVIIHETANRATSVVEHSEKQVGSRSEGGVTVSVTYGDKIDLVLTDLYMPTRKGTVLPGGLIVALAALQRGIPVCIITDGHAHCDDEMVTSLSHIQQNNERLHLYFLQDESSKGFKCWGEGGWRTDKLVKDWEFCFQQLTQATKD